MGRNIVWFRQKIQIIEKSCHRSTLEWFWTSADISTLLILLIFEWHTNWETAPHFHLVYIYSIEKSLLSLKSDWKLNSWQIKADRSFILEIWGTEKIFDHFIEIMFAICWYYLSHFEITYSSCPSFILENFITFQFLCYGLFSCSIYDIMAILLPLG